MKKTVGGIQHYEDWKDRRRIFDQAFTRRLALARCHACLTLVMHISAIFVV